MQVQNVRPGFRYGLAAGLMNSGLEALVWPLLLGGPPWQWQNTQPDCATLAPAARSHKPQYEKCASSSDRRHAGYMSNNSITVIMPTCCNAVCVWVVHELALQMPSFIGGLRVLSEVKRSEHLACGVFRPLCILLHAASTQFI